MMLLEPNKANTFTYELTYPKIEHPLVLPKTRYYGSKRRHASWLLNEFRQLNRGKVLDLFGGTATTSLIFKHLGNQVFFYDCFTFNRICASALLNGPHKTFDLNNLTKFIDSVILTEGFISSCFQGMYFTDIENYWLDGISTSINRLRDAHKKNILFYCLFQACLAKRPFNLFHRANLDIRNNHKSSKFGNKTTWEKSFKTLMLSAYLELETAWKISEGSAEIICDFETSGRDKNFDTIYIDPPYIRSDRSHESYATRYHFLEGLANYSKWPNWIDYTSRIRKLKPQAQPPEWKNSTDFTNGMANILENYKSKYIVISYAEKSKPELCEIVKILKTKNAKIDIHKKAYKCSLSSSVRDEYLIIAELEI